MDNNNWRPNPSQGPVVGGGGGGGGVGGGGVGAPGGGGGEAAMDSVDWRSQLQPDSRQRIVNKIMETLKRHLPVSGQEGLHELRKIAIRFEEKIYTAATSQSDYLRKLSLKMLTMETKSQNPIGNALPSNSAGNSNKSPDAVMRTRRGLCYPRVVEDKNMRVVKQMRDFAAEQVSYQKRSRNSSDIAGKRDLFDALPDDLVISILCKLSSSATCPFDFANVLLTCRRLNGLVPNSLEQPDSRQRIANKIMETLKRHLLVSGQEGLHELRKISIRFEEKVYTAATSQSDYLRKISKMITMETKSQNPIGNALPSNSAGNINMSPDAGGGGGGGVGAPEGGGGEAAMDSVDWQLQPDSRLRIVNKIMETWKRHLPVSGQEGLHELGKIAIMFEEKIYIAATSQSDYLRKLSLKMLTMELYL